jgi:hypothetical protein
LYLRQNYHFGPAKISMYLARYHDVTISASVWRILKRLDLNRLPASQRYKRLDRRWQRYETQLPGHQIQIDVKFIAIEIPNRATMSSRTRTRSRPTVGEVGGGDRSCRQRMESARHDGSADLIRN